MTHTSAVSRVSAVISGLRGDQLKREVSRLGWSRQGWVACYARDDERCVRIVKAQAADLGIRSLADGAFREYCRIHSEPRRPHAGAIARAAPGRARAAAGTA